MASSAAIRQSPEDEPLQRLNSGSDKIHIRTTPSIHDAA
jgi:hypothetical protein